MNPTETMNVADVAEALARASSVVALTGAGMSAESDVPTFRDALAGLWSRFDPHRLATPHAFQEDPTLVFGWYLFRLRSVLDVEPHGGYHALTRLERAIPQFTVVTQNVDGLHQRSGGREVVELHGSLVAFRCFDLGHPYAFDRIVALARASEHEERVTPPACPTCGSPVRPGVVWFGEALPAPATARAWSAVSAADVVLVVGTSSLVYPAAELPMEARRHGAMVVEINPDETPLTPSADVSWRCRAGEVLPQLADAVARARVL